MPRPHTAPSPNPLETLEEAFDLLERAPAASWVRFLAGAAPLIVGLLFVWNEFSGAQAQSRDPILASLLLVALLAWFYRCRQIFAGDLRRILSPAAASVKQPTPGWSLACFEATKLVAVPIASLSLLPLALTTGFYRSLTLFAGEGLPPREAVAKAWKAGSAWQRENWFLLAVLSLFSLVVFVDVAIAVIVAPMLAKMFTGFESVFTERGAASLGIEFPIIVALTWLCLDPLLQAVYVIRAFQWEGLSTGEDLLARLQRIAPALLLLAVVAMPARISAATPVSSDALNQSIDRTLQSQDYIWRIPPPPDRAKKDWFIDTVDRAVALLRKGWRIASDLWSDLLQWIDRSLRNSLPAIGKVQPGQPRGVRPAFYGIGLAITVLALILVWRFRPRRRTLASVSSTAPPVDLNREEVLASDLPEEEWLRIAENYANAGDLRLALRALYLGTLALLGRRGLLTIHACKSNRDYEGELRRRSRDSGLTQTFRLNVRSFEQSWYGFHEVTREQLQNFRDNLGRMRAHAA